MKFLIVGHGAREHALLKRLIREGHYVSVFATHPNVGLELDAHQITIESSYDPHKVLEFACSESYDLIIPCTEKVLFKGITELCRQKNIPILGPSKEIVQLEENKYLAKTFASGISYCQTINTNAFATIEEAKNHVVVQSPRLFVLKVLLHQENTYRIFKPEQISQAFHDIQSIESEIEHIVVEEFIQGEDFSLTVLANEKYHIEFPIVRDFPFRFAGNSGPKTGGMGCVLYTQEKTSSSAKIGKATKFVDAFLSIIRERCNGSFSGVFSFQFIASDGNVYFNEVDIRPGDPEMINLVDSIRTPIANALVDCANGKEDFMLDFHQVKSLSVCFVPPRYPNRNTENNEFRVNPFIEQLGCQLFWGPSQKTSSGVLVTGQGRTLTLIAKGSDTEIENCLKKATLHISGLDHRSDLYTPISLT